MKSIKLISDIMQNRDITSVNKTDFEGNNITVKMMKFPATSMENIRDIERKMNTKIPSDYVNFLLYSNGMELFNYEDLDGLELLGINEIDKYTMYSKRTFEEDWLDNTFIFAKIIGEDNYLGFRMNGDEYVIIDCYFELLPVEWQQIGNTFDDFLSEYIVKGGNKFWIS